MHLFMVRNPLNTYDLLLDMASQAQRVDQEKLQDKNQTNLYKKELHHLVPSCYLDLCLLSCFVS